jgi:hypothetical protein
VSGVTILEYILDKSLDYAYTRLGRLIEIDAPKIVLISLEEQINKMENGEIKISGDASLLDREVESVKGEKGRGGKSYIRFNGSILYFPNAKYGRYIKEGE